MRIVAIGGGPAGLFFSLLMKKAYPDTEIEIYERNKPDDTFGWGVVFSEATLGNIAAADPEVMAEIRAQFRYWDEIETYYGGEKVVSTGHGFCGLSRRQLLKILHKRCADLGIKIAFETEIEDLDRFADADLILGADGANSLVRKRFAEHFKPSIDWRHCKFAWFGTDKAMSNFTFVFKETEHGLFQVHAYPFEEGFGTWIIECHEEVWLRAGLDKLDEEQSLAFCQALFADELAGHRLLSNRSIWRSFPTIHNESYHHENVVLLGDAAHTAHFSIGSGTKLALEDAITLAASFQARGNSDVPAVLQAYQEARYIEVIKLQKTAQTSLEWFENSQRYMQQDPAIFSFNLMTRSKAITYDNLQVRDPDLVARVRKVYAEANGRPAPEEAPVPIFCPYKIADLGLVNRIVVSPMCQYSSEEGMPTDWHMVHLGGLALGGAGLIFTEMTNVSPEGRITPGCSGMWSEAHAEAWRPIVSFVHEHSAAKVAMQLAHAGRKASCELPWVADDQPLGTGAWQTIGPDEQPFRPDWPAPRPMQPEDMARVRDQFCQSAKYAAQADFDMIELHMAHGYLLSSFISPLSNQRADEYGGSLENRMRFPLQVLAAVRAVWPAEKPISVRISASDWAEDAGIDAEEAVLIARMLAASGCDIIDVSSGGNSPDHIPNYGRMYQVPFAEKIRYEAPMPVIAVGAILGPDHCNTILAAGRADLCAMARPHLRDAWITRHAAEEYEFSEQYWPKQYLAGRS